MQNIKVIKLTGHSRKRQWLHNDGMLWQCILTLWSACANSTGWRWHTVTSINLIYCTYHKIHCSTHSVS